MENLVRHIKKYVHLTEGEVQKIRQEVRVTPVKKKGFVLRKGTICQSTYFVSRGCVRMYFIKDNGTEQITQFAIENWWISDYMSLLRQEASTYFIQAVEDTRIIQINTASEEELCKEIPQLERYFRRVLQHAYAASQFRINLHYGLSREELYHHFSRHFPDFVQRVPQYMLASYLGFTPEYLSEIRKKTFHDLS